MRQRNFGTREISAVSGDACRYPSHLPQWRGIIVRLYGLDVLTSLARLLI